MEFEPLPCTLLDLAHVASTLPRCRVVECLLESKCPICSSSKKLSNSTINSKVEIGILTMANAGVDVSLENLLDFLWYHWSTQLMLSHDWFIVVRNIYFQEWILQRKDEKKFQITSHPLNSTRSKKLPKINE